ncbi:SipW-dependent-type signal peptide-containing protein [Eubacterium limosum]|uniref:SipW-dependent-type signal peptide-containing protein n=1 Tax=Eubacterium limosum TaxID=1736 RepID=UPI0022E78DF5|nr:SipW-dependent-type signal peptide-containing protein [Eubacterium limosum]
MTKKKKAALLISALALIAVIVVGGTLAYFTSQDDATNVFTLGKVSGDLTEETKKDTVDGHDVKPGTPTDDGIEYEKVMPGDWLSKEPRVSLKADSEDAYVRVKLEVDVLEGTLNDGQKAEIISANCLNFGEKWVVSGDYIYYQDVLTTKSNGSSQTDPVFTIVKIPGKSWDNDAASAKFTIKVTADLIQADNFTPVKTGDTITSWGNVEIKK